MIYDRFTPESGHSEGSHGMSVNDPKRTFAALAPDLSSALRKPHIFGAIRDLNFAACRRKQGNYAERTSLSSTRLRSSCNDPLRMPSASSWSVADHR